MREGRWDRLNDVVAMMREGVDLYRNAADRTAAPALAALLRENAASRAAAADNLSRELGAPGDEPSATGWSERTVGWIAFANACAERTDEALVAELEAHEARVLLKLALAIEVTPEDAIASRALLIAHAALAQEFVARMRAAYDRARAALPATSPPALRVVR